MGINKADMTYAPYNQYSLKAEGGGWQPGEHKVGDDGHHDVRPYKVNLVPEHGPPLGALRCDLGQDADAALNANLGGEGRVGK